MIIRKLKTQEEITASKEVIQQAFLTIREQFGFTESNCPTHPSFISNKRLLEMREMKLGMYGLFLGNNQIGFVALEKGNDLTYYIEKLAVLPQYRHNGYGKLLVTYIEDEAKRMNGTIVSAAIFDEQEELKAWYKQLGFQETGTKKFDHLPFMVCFLEKKV